MNITEILKDCPRGTKLYSLIHGECDFLYVSSSSNVLYPIKVGVGDGTYSFTKNGMLYAEYNGECVLFPSKENRDWSTFKIHKEHQFTTFNKVLTRDCSDEPWHINLFSHIAGSPYKYVCLNGAWVYCIPYKGNEHLLNTNNNPE